jgi:hypothetical protein
MPTIHGGCSACGLQELMLHLINACHSCPSCLLLSGLHSLHEIATLAGCRSVSDTHPLNHSTLSNSTLTHTPHCCVAPAAVQCLQGIATLAGCRSPFITHPLKNATCTHRPHCCAAPAAAQCLQEIATLAGCRSPFITRYHASLIPPGSSQLLIVMELLLGSVADAVRRCCYATLAAAATNMLGVRVFYVSVLLAGIGAAAGQRGRRGGTSVGSCVGSCSWRGGGTATWADVVNSMRGTCLGDCCWAAWQMWQGVVRCWCSCCYSLDTCFVCAFLGLDSLCAAGGGAAVWQRGGGAGPGYCCCCCCRKHAWSACLLCFFSACW